jgi:hypothetical protein
MAPAKFFDCTTCIRPPTSYPTLLISSDLLPQFPYMISVFYL